MRFYLIKLFLFLVFATCALRGLSQQAVIFNFSETVMPGETAGLQGADFGEVPKVWLTVLSEDKKIQLKVLTGNNSYLAVAIPSNIKTGLYQVSIENGNGAGKPILINQARVMHIEYNQLLPGSKFRLFGRNLSIGKAQGYVRLIDAKNNKSYTLRAASGDATEQSYQVPINIPAGTYQLKVGNGFGGSNGEHLLAEQISISSKKGDLLNLNVPWAVEFDFLKNIYNVKKDNRLKLHAKGNGTDNDQPAIQEAIDRAWKDGGGMVVLPPGKYPLRYSSGSGITMRPRVVIKGSGMDNTEISYGYGDPFSTERVKAPYGWTLGWPDARAEGIGILWPGQIKQAGISSLTLRNVNTSGKFVHTIKDMPEGGQQLFLQNCHIDVNTGWGVALVNVNHLLITGCTFESRALDVRNVNAPTRTWLWDLKNSGHVTFTNNQHFYYAGRFGANGCYESLFENNRFIRNGDHQSKGETGGLSLDYVRKLVISNNSFTVTGAPIPNRNQGETILTQGGNPNQQTFGTVTRATSNSIIDKKQEFQDFTDRVCTDWQYAYYPSNHAIAIVQGAGAGQWRSINWNNDTTLTVSRPWDVTPAPGSRYVIMQWSAEQMLIKNNLLRDNNRGIWVYSGAQDVYITGNRLINSEGIYLRADQRLYSNRYNLLWNVGVNDNHVIDSNGRKAAYICAWLSQVKSKELWGTGILNVEMRHNKIQAFSPNLTTNSWVKGEGFINYAQDEENRGPLRDPNAAGILGTIIEKNTVINADHAYRTGAGAPHGVIINGKTTNVKQFLLNQPGPQGLSPLHVDSLSHHTKP